MIDTKGLLDQAHTSLKDAMSSSEINRMQACTQLSIAASLLAIAKALTESAPAKTVESVKEFVDNSKGWKK